MEHNKCYGLVFDIIKKYASEDKPISQTEILKKITKDPENKCDRKTVGRAITRLIAQYGKDEDGDWIHEKIHFHYKEIPRGNSPILKDFWFEFEEDDDGFSDAELIFLMDAVQFSKHISKSDAEAITKKLLNLSHNKYSAMFELYKNVNEKNVPVNKKLFEHLGMINNAIHQQKMISFYTADIGTDKKLHRVGDEPVKTCPYKVVVADGYYYLLCGEKHSLIIRRYRVDRISGLKILDESFAHSVARITAALHSNEYIAEHCYMNIGETVDVTLEIDRKILGDVIDTFGNKITIDPAHPEINRLTVHVKSSEKDIIDWAMRYGEYAVILAPDNLRDEIRERSHILTRAYSDSNTDIEYLELIKKIGNSGRLRLYDIDLNRQDSYRDLTGIRTAVFRRNGITDFSFLASYNELHDLTISHNEISDPGVISGLGRLRHLTLDSTGITNLDFLEGLENLIRLSINEYSLENIEAIYHLPRLKFLTVNKTIFRLIDQERFRTIDGRPVQITTDNHAGRGPFFLSPTRLPREESRVRGRFEESIASFETCEVTDEKVRDSLIAEINTGARRFNRDMFFNIIDESCSGYERLNLYEDPLTFAGEEYTWYVTYEGPASEQITDIDRSRIYAISIFKQDHGKKLVLMAAQNVYRFDYDDPQYRDSYDKHYPSICAHIQFILNNHIGWAEVGGELERYFGSVGTINDLINPAQLVNHRVFRNIEIDADNYHYRRMVDGEKRPVKKISYGYIE